MLKGSSVVEKVRKKGYQTESPANVSPLIRSIGSELFLYPLHSMRLDKDALMDMHVGYCYMTKVYLRICVTNHFTARNLYPIDIR